MGTQIIARLARIYANSTWNMALPNGGTENVIIDHLRARSYPCLLLLRVRCIFSNHARMNSFFLLFCVNHLIVWFMRVHIYSAIRTPANKTDKLNRAHIDVRQQSKMSCGAYLLEFMPFTKQCAMNNSYSIIGIWLEQIWSKRREEFDVTIHFRLENKRK